MHVLLGRWMGRLMDGDAVIGCWMDGWRCSNLMMMDGWQMDDEWIDEWMNDSWMMDGWMGGGLGRWMDEEAVIGCWMMDGWMDGDAVIG